MESQTQTLSHRREVRPLLHLSNCCFTTPNKIMGAADMIIITVDLGVNEEQSLIVGDKLRPDI